MIHTVRGFSEAVKRFVEQRIPRCEKRGLYPGGTGIAVADNDLIIGGFYYHHFDPESGVVEISAAADDKRWLTRRVLYDLFSYPFDELGCQMVLLRHSANDKPLARMLRAYGFDQVTIPRLFGRNEDCIISTLTVEAWRNNGFHKEA